MKCWPHLLMLDSSAFSALLGKETLLDADMVRWLIIWFVTMIKFIAKMRIRIPGQRHRFRRGSIRGIVGFEIDPANQTRMNLKNIQMSLHFFVARHNIPRLSLHWLARTALSKIDLIWKVIQIIDISLIFQLETGTGRLKSDHTCCSWYRGWIFPPFLPN